MPTLSATKLDRAGAVAATLAYYEANAERFVAETLELDLRALYTGFLARLPKGARILDAGCGSGRDTRYFLRAGYRVTAFDASARVARLASEITGQRILVRSFHEVDWEGEFDGVWACASLLHLPKTDLPAVLSRLVKALKRGGILFASFRYGRGEVLIGGRFFNCYTERTLRSAIRQQVALKTLDLWVTEDARPSHPGNLWLNCLLEHQQAKVL